LKILRKTLGLRITARNDQLRFSGDSTSVNRAVRVIEQLSIAAHNNQPMTRQQLLEAIAEEAGTTQGTLNEATGTGDQLEPLHPDQLDVYLRDRRIKAKTSGQRQYLEAILKHDLTFCVGPAGTGKTYLAVAAAVAMLKHGMVRRVALVRPAVEAGEKLGFLPGDMKEKVNPYLRPLNDALHDMMEYEQVQQFMSHDVIEVIPLAFMRGRTLNGTVIILDEAQNTTAGQMLMFLTRLGQGGKMIVIGDTTQIDLEEPSQSGLIDGIRRLRHVKGVAMVPLGQQDIVRHSLVRKLYRLTEMNPNPDEHKRRAPRPDNHAGSRCRIVTALNDTVDIGDSGYNFFRYLKSIGHGYFQSPHITSPRSSSPHRG